MMLIVLEFPFNGILGCVIYAVTSPWGCFMRRIQQINPRKREGERGGMKKMIWGKIRGAAEDYPGESQACQHPVQGCEDASLADGVI